MIAGKVCCLLEGQALEGGGCCESTSITKLSFSFRGFGGGTGGGRLFPFLFVFDGCLLYPLTTVDAVPCFASLAFFRGGGAGDCSSRHSTLSINTYQTKRPLNGKCYVSALSLWFLIKYVKYYAFQLYTFAHFCEDHGQIWPSMFLYNTVMTIP